MSDNDHFIKYLAGSLRERHPLPDSEEWGRQLIDRTGTAKTLLNLRNDLIRLEADAAQIQLLDFFIGILNGNLGFEICYTAPEGEKGYQAIKEYQDYYPKRAEHELIDDDIPAWAADLKDRVLTEICVGDGITLAYILEKIGPENWPKHIILVDKVNEEYLQSQTVTTLAAIGYPSENITTIGGVDLRDEETYRLIELARRQLPTEYEDVVNCQGSTLNDFTENDLTHILLWANHYAHIMRGSFDHTDSESLLLKAYSHPILTGWVERAFLPFIHNIVVPGNADDVEGLDEKEVKVAVEVFDPDALEVEAAQNMYFDTSREIRDSFRGCKKVVASITFKKSTVLDILGLLEVGVKKILFTPITKPPVDFVAALVEVCGGKNITSLACKEDSGYKDTNVREWRWTGNKTTSFNAG